MPKWLKSLFGRGGPSTTASQESVQPTPARPVASTPTPSAHTSRAEASSRGAETRLDTLFGADDTRYMRDRDDALRWYAQQRLPDHDRRSVVGADTLNALAGRADQESLWKESWAGSHLALDGYRQLPGRADRVPVVLRRLGRAHCGLANYALSIMYFEAARISGATVAGIDEDFITLTYLEQAAANVLAEDEAAYGRTLDALTSTLLPGGHVSPKAHKFAMHCFQQGSNNAGKTRDGRPIVDCQFVALGFFRVSTDLNRRLGEVHGLAVGLVNMGDIARELGRVSQARTYWQESIDALQGQGDQSIAQQARERLASSASLGDAVQPPPPTMSSQTMSPPTKPTCKRCGTTAFREHEFLKACEDAGLHVDAQGRVALRLGNLAGDMNSIATGIQRQQTEQQARFDSLDQRKGFQCTGCGSVYCMNCLFNFAPPHPRGGKGCPSCGGSFKLFT